MSKFLIKLTPLDTFFFSQENKYRRKLVKDEKGNKKYITEADYYQKSAYFPQQTTLFGMLRYYVLLKNGQIPITDQTKAEELIGEKSFDIGAKNPNFGTINRISSAFIIDSNGKFFFKNPKDLVLAKGKPIALKRINAPFKSNLSNDAQYFCNYVEKRGLGSYLHHSNMEVLPFDFDVNDKDSKGIFIKKERVGITKKEKGGTDIKAFYKQDFYSLKDGYSFGIIADLEKMEEHTGYVSMGAEKSAFQISLKKYDNEVENEINIENTNNPKIVLLSDAYLSQYNKTDFQFAISTIKTFRFLNTEVKKGKEYYSSDPLKKKDIKRSDKYNLLERGSVFYFQNEQQMNKFSEKLNNENNFVQIGYNQHKKIK